MKIQELIQVQKSDRDISWLRDALQTALKLEFSTLPPYLIALWTINDRNSFAYQSIRNQIAEEEMLHMGLVCNLIVAMGGKPDLTSSDGVPTYPGPLPGMVQSDLEVSLARYSPEALQTFLAIEYPENPPLKIGNDPKPNSQTATCASDCAKTIGQFYTEVFKEFQDLQNRGELPEFDTSKQIEYKVDFGSDPDRDVFIIDSLEDVESAIAIIKRQGEGTGVTPIDTGEGDLSHYYRYLELDRGRRIQDKDGNGHFAYSDKPEDRIPVPIVYPMATIPENGYIRENVPDDSVWENITKFDRTYSLMLLQIERAWSHTPEQGGGVSSLEQSVGTMLGLGSIARELMEVNILDGSGQTYGPCFRFDPTVSLSDGDDSDDTDTGDTGGINPSPTWENSIKNFFDTGDIACMKARGMDLGDYQTVKDNAPDISRSVESGHMPPGEDNRWSSQKVEAFKRWIDRGMPKGDVTTTPPVNTKPGWSPTNAPEAGSRYDDIWFISPEIGWAVNSDGLILHTEDGGMTWTKQFRTPTIGTRAVYLRCISFANEQKGWVGTLTPDFRMFKTENGGTNWQLVTNLPNRAPLAICGLYVVNESVVYASGTNYPYKRYPTGVIKTTDGGNTWRAIEMGEYASNLIDIFFWDELRGFVVGGYSDKQTEDPEANVPDYTDVIPVVLYTEDGGNTWVNRVENLTFELGEWGWKIYFVNENVGYVSLESFTRGAVLKTTDGGQSWIRLPIDDPQENVNLEGVGFIDEERGWVGGWGSADFTMGYTSSTIDGGITWANANQIGRFINRFRFLGDPISVGYACGKMVYKYNPQGDSVPTIPQLSDEILNPAHSLVKNVTVKRADGQVEFELDLPENVQRVWLHIWNRFGLEIRLLLNETNPTSGIRKIIWDGLDNDNQPVTTSIYIFRLTVDDTADSGNFYLERRVSDAEI